MDVEQKVGTYRSQVHIYERFTVKVRELLEELLGSNNINATYEHRTKSVGSFKEKISRPDKSYDDPLHDITDLCGIRIIVRRVSDVLDVIDVIKGEFHIDDENSVYKAEELNVDQFGYTSVHLVISLDKGRCALTEWRLFKEIKVEIQIRTILQHAWAVISHAFDYKVGADIPREFRRRLFRLSALFELADEELDQLADDIEEKVEKYRSSLGAGDTQIELNVDSLRTYLETANEAKYWVDFVASHFSTPIVNLGDLSWTLNFIKFFGLKTIKDLQRLLINTRGWGEALLVEHINHITRTKSVMKVQDVTVNGILLVLTLAANVEYISLESLANEFPTIAFDDVYSAAVKVRGMGVEKSEKAD